MCTKERGGEKKKKKRDESKIRRKYKKKQGSNMYRERERGQRSHSRVVVGHV